MAFPAAVHHSSGDAIGAAATRTVSLALQALQLLQSRFAEPEFHDSFERLVRRIAASQGRLIIAGIGKSGIIARKITATLTSTGTPAAFLHPTDAGHGDMGMISSDDIVLVLSSSGETAELRAILDYCKRFAIPLVAVTKARSTVARAADECIQLPPVREACSNELSPTTSTTLQVVFGDALAVALMELRGFSAEDFYRFHPRGRLGARLRKVRDLMARGSEIPMVAPDASLLDATVEMTRGRLGGTAVVDDAGVLVGVFTDGDLRRTAGAAGRMSDPVGDHMTPNPRWIAPDELASEALRRMQEAEVLLLFVCDGGGLVGAIHMHDLLRAGIA